MIPTLKRQALQTPSPNGIFVRQLKQFVTVCDFPKKDVIILGDDVEPVLFGVDMRLFVPCFFIGVEGDDVVVVAKLETGLAPPPATLPAILTFVCSP